MRKLDTTIDSILALLPADADTPPDFKDNLTTLKAELRIFSRTADYLAPEGDADAWRRLGAALYRYMPPTTAYPWAKAVSDIITATP